LRIEIDWKVAWGGRTLARLGIVLALAVAAASAGTTAASVAGAWDQYGAEGALWQLMNGARVNNGLAPVQQDGTVVGLARWRSQDMIERGYFSHTIPGCGCEVYSYYDSNGINYVLGGENIGWNSGWSDAESPVRIHEGFMASPGHRANVLEARWTHGGIGAYGRDGVSYLNGEALGNLRMYTELFYQAGYAAPPPAAPAPAPAAPAAPAPAPAAPPPAAPAAAPVAAAPSSAAPAPAPAAAIPVPVAQEAAPVVEEEPVEVAVAAPEPPRPTRPVDGRIKLIDREEAAAAAAARPPRDLNTAARQREGGAPSVAASRGSFRVDAAEPSDQGIFDTILRGILSFLLG
jgi:uncharacterized protein YkwD